MTAYLTRHLPQRCVRYYSQALRWLCGIAFVVLLTGCEEHAASIVLPAPLPVVERTANQGIALRWDNYQAGTTFPVYISEQASSPDMRAPFTTLDSKRKVIYGLGDRRHYYFFWQESPGKLHIIAER